MAVPLSKISREIKKVLKEFLEEKSLFEKFISCKKDYNNRFKDRYGFDYFNFETDDELFEEVVKDMKKPQIYDNNVFVHMTPECYIAYWMDIEDEWLMLCRKRK